MGAWGHGPLDNDTAADWFTDIGKFTSDKINEAFAPVLAVENLHDLEVMAVCRVDELHTAYAACYLVLRLCDNWTWDTDRLEQDQINTFRVLARYLAAIPYMSWRNKREAIKAAVALLGDLWEKYSTTLSPEQIEPMEKAYAEEWERFGNGEESPWSL